MPAPIITNRTGTGWTIDVTTLGLSADLAVNDFRVYLTSSLQLTGLTKTTSTIITYSGAALAAATPLKVFRYSPVVATPFAFGEVNSSGGLNSRFTQVLLVLEDLRVLQDTPP